MREINNNTLMWMLAAFIISWLATEFSEFFERENYWAEVRSFMAAEGPAKGNRFTRSDGEELEQRIESLEQRVIEIEDAQ